MRHGRARILGLISEARRSGPEAAKAGEEAEGAGGEQGEGGGLGGDGGEGFGGDGEGEGSSDWSCIEVIRSQVKGAMAVEHCGKAAKLLRKGISDQLGSI